MKTLKFLLFISILAIITSCSFYILDNNEGIYKGMSEQEFKKIDIDYDDMYVIEDKALAKKGRFIMYTYEVEDTGSDQIYYYLFKDNELVYWGYPYKFNRHEDEDIRMASLIIAREFK
ncbi:MAG: hypothetical protein Kapaf2KO_23590 [Candidatus Kapaibacteriales bacterium]